MPVWKLSNEAEEQLDIETAVKSAQESDHMLGVAGELKVAEADKAETAIKEPRGHERQWLRRPCSYPMRRVMWVWMTSWLKQPRAGRSPRTSLINRISGLWSGKTDSALAASQIALGKRRADLVALM